MNLVIDVNDFISALIGKSHRKKLELLLANTSIDVFASEHLLTELTEVAQRDKFKKYISREDTALFLEIVRLRLTIITPTTVITDCTDPDDNYLLALAIDAKADYLITGDKADLLVMSPYRGVPIVRLQTVLNILANP